MKKRRYTAAIRRAARRNLAKARAALRRQAAADSKVDHPSHYNAGKIEVIDAIDDWGLGFCEGNVVKYVARAKHKGNELEDFEKSCLVSEARD